MAKFMAVTKTKAWQKLLKTEINGTLPKFNGAMVKEFEPWTLDLTRSGMEQEHLQLLLEAAEQCQIKKQICSAFEGDKINLTEDRAVLHMSLRDSDDDPLTPEFARTLVQKELNRLRQFSSHIRQSKFTDVVNIGIGGSDLGPKLLSESLKPFATGPDIHYVSNVDPAHLAEVLKDLNPQTTLFIVVSKTFTTQETMMNAQKAKLWGQGKSQFCAVTSNQEKAKGFGISKENTFTFWDWVGGRYSLWSAVGLSSLINVGAEVFDRVLSGAHKADKDFLEKPLTQNLPVLLALWDIWNVNIGEHDSVAILPYEQNLQNFTRWFQQLAMESNGKSVDRESQNIDYSTSPVYWGEVGTNGQHAFYQQLHQGTLKTPCEFIAFAKSNYDDQEAHHFLLANMLGQAKALAEGAKNQKPYKHFEGQRASVTLLGDQASPERIGELLAIYEHRVMAQGFLWNISSFDQWGVELGKKLATTIINNWDDSIEQDEATKLLISKIRKSS